jgi:hypothetical protein
MKVLAPHISCVVRLPLSEDDPNELQQAMDEGYTEIFVLSHEGIIKHHRLRGENRYIRLKVKEIPGVALPVVKEEIRFLPAGKIPYDLFQKIEAFFKKVMAMKKGDLEAMIWILWNPEQGYHLHVPEQTVSKASVRYDWDNVPSGSSIIVDIH